MTYYLSTKKPFCQPPLKLASNVNTEYNQDKAFRIKDRKIGTHLDYQGKIFFSDKFFKGPTRFFCIEGFCFCQKTFWRHIDLTPSHTKCIVKNRNLKKTISWRCCMREGDDRGRREVTVDFSLGENNYFVDLDLTISKMPEETNCSICQAPPFIKSGEKNEASYLVTAASIKEIREVKMASPIEHGSLQALQVQQHIEEALLNPESKVTVCWDCLTLFWLLLDKK